MRPRVLAAIDDSLMAHPVLDAARTVAEFYEASVEAVHVLERPETQEPSSASVAHVRALALAASVPLTVLDPSEVPRAISASVAAPDVVALVIGANSSVAGHRPGHVTLDIAGRVHKPVFVIPPALDSHRHLRRVLVPLDGNIETADAGLDLIHHAQRSAVEILLLHVIDPRELPPYDDHAEYEAVAWREEFLRKNIRISGNGLDLQLRSGIPSGEILDAARDHEVDAILLAWSCDLAGHDAYVVRELLARSHTPLILVPTTCVSRREPEREGAER